MTNLGRRLLWSALLVVLADLLLYHHSPGIGISIFAIATGTLVWAHARVRLRRAGFWLILWCVLAVGEALESSIIGIFLIVLLGWAILAMALMPERPPLFIALLRGLTGGGRSFTAAPTDLRRYALVKQRFITRQVTPIWVYALPALLVLVFASLIIPANLVLAYWSERLFDRGGAYLSDVTISRMLFWVAMALGTYGLFRFRLGRRRAKAMERVDQTSDTDQNQRFNQLKACLLTFAGLNILFLAANIADALYLWVRVALPAGMTYSQFAHQGSYRLIVAVVLAAITVMAFFAPTSLQASNRNARVLAYIFVVQNLVILLGAGRRLQLYIEVYGLTRFRLATFLWLILVLVGFVMILRKIHAKRPLLFLLEANARSTVLLLTLVAVLNLDGFIANWNVARYERAAAELRGAPTTDDRAEVDVEYLAGLSATALPAIARLTAGVDSSVANRARDLVLRRLAEERQELMSWQSWTWRRSSAIREAEQILEAPPPR